MLLVNNILLINNANNFLDPHSLISSFSTSTQYIMENQYEELNRLTKIITIECALYDSNKKICCAYDDCQSNKITFKYFDDKEEHIHPLFQCNNCNRSFICKSYENKCPREECIESTDVKFKYYNNTKYDQPRFMCKHCKKLYAPFPQRKPHPSGYLNKGQIIEPPKYTNQIKECPTCHIYGVSCHKFYGCNNGNHDQPRYKCDKCRTIFSPFKKKLNKSKDEKTTKDYVKDYSHINMPCHQSLASNSNIYNDSNNSVMQHQNYDMTSNPLIQQDHQNWHDNVYGGFPWLNNKPSWYNEISFQHEPVDMFSTLNPNICVQPSNDSNNIHQNEEHLWSTNSQHFNIPTQLAPQKCMTLHAPPIEIPQFDHWRGSPNVVCATTQNSSIATLDQNEEQYMNSQNPILRGHVARSCIEAPSHDFTFTYGPTNANLVNLQQNNFSIGVELQQGNYSMDGYQHHANLLPGTTCEEHHSLEYGQEECYSQILSK